VTPLLNIGGLVKYSMGKGGLVLCQLNVKDAEPVPENAQKKRAIVTALLRNLHATFAGGRLLTTANMKFSPIPLEERCNQYLTKDRGWYEGGRDLSHLPQGDVTLGGVRYVIRDFKTSPLPSCIMLDGPGARGNLPTEVRGLPVGQRADALFFLHVFNRAAEWRPSKPDDQPPVLFAYIVHYADGHTVQVPVRYGEGVEHWIQKEPTGLKDASVAWAAPFPGDASGDQAVVYQMQWNNQRPEVEIAAVDIVYGPDGSRWGTPALLAITAATEAR
jgi:beta-galactosidase